MILENDKIKLRAPDLTDLDVIYKWENDTELWYLSQTQIPFSRFDVEQFILQGNHDLYTEKQFRFMIETKLDQKIVGAIDLFDFDPKNKRAGIGILIDKDYRELGLGSQALGLLIDYAKDVLNLHQLYCNILMSNLVSLHLFKKKHFQEIGVKKDWIFIKGKYHDEVVLQLIL
jgi:diamine N-acetyltransferase